MKRFKSLFYFHDELFIPQKPFNEILGYSLEPLAPYDVYGYVEPDLLRTASTQLKSGKIAFLVGPKNSGKSSSARYYVNRLLSSGTPVVAFIDFDVGQPEFTCPGMLSLHLISGFLLSPPFHNVIKPHDHIKCLQRVFFGGITPTDNPDYYLKCMQSIFAAYQELPQPRPTLVVNTMGWTQGLGLTLLIEQLFMIKPDQVVQLELGKQNLPELSQEYLQSCKTFHSNELSNETFHHNIFIVPSPAKVPVGIELDRPYPKYRKSFGPPDHRDLTMASYLIGQLADLMGSLPGSGPSGCPVLNHPADILVECIPYRVNVRCREDASTFTLATHLLMPPTGSKFAQKALQNGPSMDMFSHRLACINASLVALVTVPEGLLVKDSKNRLVELTSLPVCECVGLAFCRATDPDTGHIYLTTGLARKDLMKVNAILKGNFNIPQAFFVEQLALRKLNSQPNKYPPYTGPQKMSGPGTSTLPSKRQYPKANYSSSSFNTGDARALDSGGVVKYRKN
ncbi:Polynucleotide 5'-hydroxyl-kinase nol9 [Cichlidogyrus casuarinus]|uniref:Polynucleotide 5'-hydroxyl-kinase nol9 n=1 Tax=Cichlidogyrus casuarinus TaxID=1844966 RepID=A0ABD2Q9T5_9PLAT